MKTTLNKTGRTYSFGAILLAIPVASAWATETITPAGSIEEGPFKPDMESFKQYRCPESFRDAKFGTRAARSPRPYPAWRTTHQRVSAHTDGAVNH